MKEKHNTRKETIAKQLGNVKNKTPMVVYLTLFIFAIVGGTSGILLLIYYILFKFGIIFEMNFMWAAVLMLFFCVVISTSLVGGLGNRILFGSLRQIKDASKAVAAGDFTQRLKPAKEKETAEICESFNEMVDRLGRNEMISRNFISNVSHQFRNPLSSIVGYSQLLEDPNLDERQRGEYVAIIREKSLALSQLVNNILEISKIERGSEDCAMSSFAADERLYKCLISFDEKLKEKDLNLDLNIRNANCYGNPDLISEAWSNLIDNAAKYSKEGGTISIRLFNNEKGTVFIISDNGVGMDESTREHIFDRFYRGKSSGSSDGSGLGMAIVKSIVDLHKGSISAESKEGWGSRFTMIIPPYEE